MNSSENTQKKILLIVNCKNTELRLDVTEDSEIIKNPVPILWNLEGMYGWVPIEIVRNEINDWTDFIKENQGFYSGSIIFTWHQTYRLRQDVGKMLEELANE